MKSMLFSFLAQILALGLLVPGAQADEVECWAPDGKTRADNETYVPCNKLGITQKGVHSSCCALDGDADKRDLCATSGLCLRGGVLSRGYCTDKNWDSPACINVCTDESSGGSANETVAITPCGTDNKYCCGNNNLDCCGTDEAFEIPTQASVISDNLTETQVVTETASASGSGQSYKDAAIGLGVVFGVGALTAIGGILWLLKQNKSLREQLQQAQQQPSVAETPAPGYSYHQGTDAGTDYTGPSSPPQDWAAYNMKPPASPSVPEVDGNTHRYSELDAAAASGNMYNGPSSPRLDHSYTVVPAQSPEQVQSSPSVPPPGSPHNPPQ